jgi:type III secretion protein C
MTGILRTILMLAVSLSAATQSFAAQIDWRQKKVNLSVVERKAADIVREIFEENLIPVTIDTSVDTVVRNMKFNLRTEDFIGLLSTKYALSVYYDGQMAYVTPSSQNVTRIYKLDKAAHEQARRIVSSLRLDDPRFPIRFDSESKMVVVSGPPRMIQALDAALTVLEDSSSTMLRSETKVIRLKNGVAQDRTVSVGGKDVVILGVASIVRRIYRLPPSLGAGAQSQTQNQRTSSGDSSNRERFKRRSF